MANSNLKKSYASLNLFEAAKLAISSKLENDMKALNGRISKLMVSNTPKDVHKAHTIQKYKVPELSDTLAFVKDAKASDFVEYVNPDIAVIREAVRDQNETLKALRLKLKAAKNAKAPESETV